MVYDDVPLTKRAILEEAKTFDLEIVTKLSCTNGRITRIASLETCKNLTELNLSGNCILEIEGLANLVKLKKLILTSNRIESLENIDQIPSLQHLLIQDNRIASFEDFKQLKNLPHLQSVYFQNHGGDLPNPICRDRRYKAQVLELLPNLRNLDGERKPTRPEVNLDIIDMNVVGELGGVEGERKLPHFKEEEVTVNVLEIVRPAKALIAEMHTLNISAKEQIQKAKEALM